jgi:6-phospho-3-hexuloisomerase
MEEIWKNTINAITQHIDAAVDTIDPRTIAKFVSAIIKAKRVFVCGAGRSGLAARAFAMRLMHLDKLVFVIGETITPSIAKNDLFICISGSGETTSIIDYTKLAKKAGAVITCVTSHPDSTIASLSDDIVVVKGKTKIDYTEDYKKRQLHGLHTSFTPMGTLFEDTVMVFFDGIIAELMSRLKKTEASMRLKHTSIE